MYTINAMPLSIAALILFCVAFTSCKPDGSHFNPVSVKGVLDLRELDDTAHHILRLDGQWEFYWNQLIKPRQFPSHAKPSAYIEVPKAWNKQSTIHYSFPAFGYATYRLLISHDHQHIGRIKTVKMPFVHTAYTLWINGKIVSKNGEVGTSKTGMIPFQQPAVVQFLIESTVTELVVHISNYQQRTGGLLKSIKYGSYDAIVKHNEYSVFMTLFVVAAIFVIIFYHFGLYILNRSYKPNLYFALFCTAIGLRILLTEEKLLIKFVPFVPWDICLRIEYITILFAVIFFTHFINEIYPKRVHAVVLRFVNGYFGAFTAFVIIAPISYVSYSLIFIQMAMFLVTVYLLVMVIRESTTGSRNALLTVTGAIVLFFSLINDILYVHRLIDSRYLFEFGLLIFVFAQSLVALEESMKLQKRLSSINSELEIARQIQRTILPSCVPLTQSITVESCYIPMDTIGGDIYDFHQVDEKRLGILIADVTGHGIPASLIASTVHIAFSLQKLYADDPLAVMVNMNNVLQGNTGGQPITALYTYIDTSQMEIKFSRAGHPFPLILKSGTKKASEIYIPGKLLGVFDDIDPDIVSCPITSKDRIILYTDGIVEVRNAKHEIFGFDRFSGYIEKFHYMNPRDFIDAIIDVVVQWAGSKERIKDDITLIIIDIN